MSGWLRLDSTTASNPRLWHLSDRAFRLWFAACCYSALHETDGEVPIETLQKLTRTANKRTIQELLDAGRFEPRKGGVVYVHDYLEKNPSRAELQDRRGGSRRRVAAWRERHDDVGDALQEPGVTRYSRAPAREGKGLGHSSKDVSGESPVDARASEEDRYPVALRLSQLLGELITGHDPKAPVQPQSDRWVRDMRLLLADRGDDAVEVERVIRWCQADSFWQSNILSPGKLRKQFTQLLLKSRNRHDGAAGNGHDPGRQDRRVRGAEALRELAAERGVAL